MLSSALDYQGSVNAALRAAGVVAAGVVAAEFPSLTWYELAGLDAARAAGVAPSTFAAELIALRGTSITLEIEVADGSGAAARKPIRPSHAQQNRWVDDAGDSCDCGHAKASHNDDGRCRARRGRCTCRAFDRVGAAARIV
jgi:hypothetical protein